MKIMMMDTKRMKTMFKYLATAVALWATPVMSMEYSKVMVDNLGRSFIVFHGDMVEGDAEKAREVLVETGVKRVGLVSNGGLASVGFELSEVLSDLRVTAVVPPGYGCISACAIAFIGALEYEIEGLLAFHAAWSDQFTDTNMAASQGQIMGVYSAYHMVNHGFSFALPLKITQETDRDTYLTFKSLDELMQFYARTDEVTGGDVADYLSAIPLINGWSEQALMTNIEIAAYILGQRPTR